MAERHLSQSSAAFWKEVSGGGRGGGCMNKRSKMMLLKMRMAHKRGAAPLWNGDWCYLLWKVEKVPPDASLRGREGFLILVINILIIVICFVIHFCGFFVFFTKKPLSLYCVGCPKSYIVEGLFLTLRHLGEDSGLLAPSKLSRKSVWSNRQFTHSANIVLLSSRSRAMALSSQLPLVCTS